MRIKTRLTIEKLLELMTEFINSRPDNDKDDWYVSTRQATNAVLDDFEKFLMGKGYFSEKNNH